MFARPSWFCSIVFACLATLALLTSPARAQCLPDNLDGGPCCGPTNAVLPQFPPTPQQVRWICFDGCQPVANVGLCANIQAPVPAQGGGAFICGVYTIRVRLRTCGANILLWDGNLNAFYSRNWQASSIPGTVNLTVWRFIVNGDLKPTVSVPNGPNRRPPCASPVGTVYFTGYIDYAYDCINNQWQVAWSVSHECDGIHHAPGTVRPAPSAGYHPTRSYTIVGPGAGFNVSSVMPLVSSGPIIQQAMRTNNWATLPLICTFEEPAQGNFVATSDFCMCSSAGAPQYNMALVNANGVCGSFVAPSPLGMLMQKRLGFWTNPNVYPGVEYLLFDFGYLDHFDACTGVASPQWFEGAETLRGYPAYDFNGLALGFQFEDLASANAAPTNPAIHIGAPHVSDYILNFNLP